MEWNLEAEDKELLDAAVLAADGAVAIHRARAGRGGRDDWEEKGVADFVTEADLEAERQIIEVLLERFPDHSILAEEGSVTETPSDGPIRWIIDPLDGTTNWLHGYPEYAVSIAAVDDEGLRIGVVVNSVTGERFTSVRGRGCRRDGEPVSVSDVDELRLALVGTGFPFKNMDLLEPYQATFGRVLRATAGIRRAGAAALDLCGVACGRFDAFWELALMPWDVAAGLLMIREAGGSVMSLGSSAERAPSVISISGADGDLLRAGGFLAANTKLFEPFRSLVEDGEVG